MALLLLCACSAEVNANPAPRCDDKAECGAGSTCYRGFCVLDAEETRAVDGSMEDPGSEADASSEVESGIQPEDGEVALPEATRDAGSVVPANPDAAQIDAATADATPAPGSDPQPGVRVDASMAPSDGATASPNNPCSRAALLERAGAYLVAMASGDVQALRAHPALRYTENGQVQTIGLGVWLSRPRVQFARHMFDEARCASITEAVINETAGRIVLGLRLRYLDDQLLEVEAMVVRRNMQYYDPDAIIPFGPDPWVQPVPAAARMSREALLALATNYLDSSTNPALLPPHAPACRRRQNGTLMDEGGSCGVRPGTQPFEERRFPVVDETAGVVTAVTMYNRFLGMYLFKAQNGVIESIEVVGGHQSRGSGW